MALEPEFGDKLGSDVVFHWKAHMVYSFKDRDFPT